MAISTATISLAADRFNPEGAVGQRLATRPPPALLNSQPTKAVAMRMPPPPEILMLDRRLSL
jgi:hypothetical protein